MMEAKLEIKVPKNWMAEISRKYPARIKIIERKPFGKNGVQDLAEISVGEDYLDKVVEDIRRNPLVSGVDVSLVEKHRALALVSTLKCPACRTLVGSDCFLISAVARGDKIEWTLIFAGKEALRELLKKLQNYNVKVLQITRIEDREILTSRQEEIIRIAFEKGYFDYPKRISIRELAKIFNVSISTLSEILRAGQKKIMDSYFKEKAA